MDTETGLSRKISEIEFESRRVAGELQNLGFGPGDVLHTGYSSCLDFYWPVFGAWLCGGVVSLGNPHLANSAIKQQIQDSEAKVVVCSASECGKYQAVAQELKNEGHPVKLCVLNASLDEILPDGLT